MVDGKVLAARFAGAADFETLKVISGGNELDIFFLDGLTSDGDIADLSCGRLVRCGRRSARRRFL